MPSPHREDSALRRTASASHDGAREPRAAVKLFLLGFVMLFLELCLIRYLSGTIWNLGYFPNLVLLAVFIGMGSGFVFHEKISRLGSGTAYQLSAVALAGLVVMVHFGRPSVPGFERGGAELGGDLYFSRTPTVVGESLILFLAWFLAVSVIYALIAHRAAKLFRLFRPLTAYTLDISGSCAGILAFMLMSWAQIPADRWFALLIPAFLFTLAELSAMRALLTIAPMAVAVGLIQYQETRLQYDPKLSEGLEVVWSPYQKIEFIPARGTQPSTIFVNGISHQSMMDLPTIRSTYYQAIHDDRTSRGLPPFEKVFIIGAGSGNDIASALAHGAKRVHAVEIDPVIADLGRRHHPAKPYLDPRVELTIDDARAALGRSTESFDLVIFALTDSLVKASPMAQLRLENYIYTVEAIRSAYSHLSDQGDLLFYNFYRREWLVDKLADMIREGTGKEPRMIWRKGDFVVLTVGRGSEARKASAGTVEVARDDWPFFYLRERGIPGVYQLAMAAMAAMISTLLFFVWRGTRSHAQVSIHYKLAFVLMGTAFLLLETKSVIQFSLLFGTTWINTSLVFLSVLLLVLAANWTAVVARARIPVPLVFGLLIVASLATLFYPLASLLSVENPTSRFVLAALLTFLPVYFANLLFSLSFQDKAEAEHLFGWNLIGATLGGVAEYSSMAIGYGALAVLVAVTYSAVFALLWLGGRSTRADVTSESVPS